MNTVEFKKNKYMFSKRKSRKEINEKLIEKQVQFYVRELKTYDIQLKDLSFGYPNSTNRDILLNIAQEIVEDEIIINKMKRTRKLPIDAIVKITKLQKNFLEMWKEYIIAYTILLYTDKYIEIYNYLNITFRELEVLSLADTNNDEKIFKGVVLEKNKKSSIILTSEGEYNSINNPSDKLGKELSGKEKKGLSHYRGIITVIGLIVIITLGIGYYTYNKEYSTILIQSTSKIKLSINKYNKIIHNYSATEKGELLLTELRPKNKDINILMGDMFKKLQQLEMVPSNRKIRIIITGKKIEEDQFTEVTKYIQELKNDEDYKNNIEIIINNVGTEKTIK